LVRWLSTMQTYAAEVRTLLSGKTRTQLHVRSTQGIDLYTKKNLSCHWKGRRPTRTDMQQKKALQAKSGNVYDAYVLSKHRAERKGAQLEQYMQKKLCRQRVVTCMTYVLIKHRAERKGAQLTSTVHKAPLTLLRGC
jgi:hypothetical protein